MVLLYNVRRPVRDCLSPWGRPRVSTSRRVLTVYTLGLMLLILLLRARHGRLRTLATDAAGELDVLWHDGHAPLGLRV